MHPVGQKHKQVKKGNEHWHDTEFKIGNENYKEGE
tara:strand:- start:358 stop:462 length:105 start_codon:yes stop_codon:yes gene_type:complete